MAEAVRRRDAAAPVDPARGLRRHHLATVGAIAAAGVDRISVGALTHSAPRSTWRWTSRPSAAPGIPRMTPMPVPAALNIPLLDRLREAAGAFVAWDDLAGGWVSTPDGAVPSRDLDQVRADLDALAAFGFAIDRHPYRGAAYLGPADRLCPDQIEHELATRRVGRRIAVWTRVSSTNDLAAGAAGSPTQRRPGRPGRGADGRPGPPRPVLDGPAAVVDPDVGPARPAGRARPGRPRVRRGLRLADRDGRRRDRRGRRRLDRARGGASSGPTTSASQAARSPASWSSGPRSAGPPAPRRRRPRPRAGPPSSASG